MIAILPVRDINTLDTLNQKENTNAHHAFCFCDGNTMQGYLLYSISDNCGQLLAYSASDKDMLDGLVRAVLSSLLDAAVDCAEFSNEFDKTVLRELKILGETEEKVTSIDKLFYCCKGCLKSDVK